MTQEIVGGGLPLGSLGLGGAPLGNLFTRIDDSTAQATVDAAWEEGVRFFDTAPHYGLGLSERRLGRALAHRPRDEYVVCSKVGRLLVEQPAAGRRDDEGFDVPATHRRVRDYSRDGVLRSIDATLRRTGLDRLDVVLVHDPDEHWAQAAEQAIPALAELRDQGVVRAIGAGMNQSGMLTRFLTETAADIVLLAGRYTLLDQQALDDVLPAADRLGKSVIAAGVFNSGLLADPDPDATYDYARAPGHLVERARRIAAVCADHGTTLTAAAVAFPLLHPAVVSVVVGARSPEEMHADAQAHRAAVPAAVWTALQARGLLRPDIPVG
ncbi:aldo/keto reductase [Nakamurella flava]|uniref:Aldo/keto reductase n=1 Tax=Nakamurella flava TaxID=2576308 RepID=A0A4V6CT13_9ACTN|nr:aldo/keto reductase [Nakamurella flava]TKV57825.1 aldo/keto reductase [Nakamurella flava]